MCGIFGSLSKSKVDLRLINTLANYSARRGKDSSGYMYYTSGNLAIVRADLPIKETLKNFQIPITNFVAGHSRLITNGQSDNQPILRNGIVIIHNGIIVNEKEIWAKIDKVPIFEIDSEILAGFTEYCLENGDELETIAKKLLKECEGVVSAVIALPHLGKLLLLSNNGSLYVGKNQDSVFFCSEKFPLLKIKCDEVVQVKEFMVFDFSPSTPKVTKNLTKERSNLIPALSLTKKTSHLLDYEMLELKRCCKCILPETMPFIEFDAEGICNYCRNYKIRNAPKPLSDLEEVLEKYMDQNGQVRCVFPFSGGRDSSFGLHLAVKQLNLRPIAYTYDWGMVTDLGRRNISRMCGKLGVENIVIAANIEWKRSNIRKNLLAWLKAPNLGMLSMLTAGDKHFFRHIESVKRETGISLNLWSVNPLEVTHFKTGFMGIPPDFDSARVYQSGIPKQVHYQKKRLGLMLQSPGYFNLSIFDTLSGEYFRSKKKKLDYFHLFDFYKWDEAEIDSTLELYDWEKAPDTSTTWRIGDGTAAFYNYVTHRVAGFSENDTFRSNQIREGQITREEALVLTGLENQPRYQNLRWYLEVLNMPFKETLEQINKIKRMTSKY